MSKPNYVLLADFEDARQKVLALRRELAAQAEALKNAPEWVAVGSGKPPETMRRLLLWFQRSLMIVGMYVDDPGRKPAFISITGKGRYALAEISHWQYAPLPPLPHEAPVLCDMAGGVTPCSDCPQTLSCHDVPEHKEEASDG